MIEYWEGFAVGFTICSILSAYVIWKVLNID